MVGFVGSFPFYILKVIRYSKLIAKPIFASTNSSDLWYRLGSGSATWLCSGHPRGYLSFLQKPILLLDLFGFSVSCFPLELLFPIPVVFFANKLKVYSELIFLG